MEQEKNISGLSDSLSGKLNIEKETGYKEKFKLFKNLQIGISISESQELQQLGYSKIHQEDLMIEFAKYFLVQGASLLYGGDLRDNGYTTVFSHLANIYRNNNDTTEERVINYFCWPNYLKLDKKAKLDWKGKVKIVTLPPPSSLNVDIEKYVEPDSPEDKYNWAMCLTDLRIKLAKSADARIFIGGQIQNFKGRIPGILEEAYHSLKENKPCYFVGMFGGASKMVIDAITMKSVENLDLVLAKRNPQYSAFLDYYTQRNAGYDFPTVISYIKNIGLEGLAQTNGLSIAENERLFETPHISEQIYLVIKGLKNQFKIQ